MLPFKLKCDKATGPSNSSLPSQILTNIRPRTVPLGVSPLSLQIKKEVRI
jgi:hypothetical protein